jgi:hypothetical protein
MMRRLQWVAVCVCALFVGLEARAQAPVQGPYVRPQVNPYNRPAVSPYLNLFRTGAPALNYYNLVRPQQEVRTSLNLLDARADLLGQSLAEDRPELVITGHPSHVMTHGRYYFSLGSRSGSVRPATMPASGLGTQR